MTLEEHLLNQLADECLEVGHRALKAQKFGIEEVQATGPSEVKTGESSLPNNKRIEQEYADLVGTYDILVRLGLLRVPDQEAVNRKKVKIAKYLRYAMQIGTLADSPKLRGVLHWCDSFRITHCPRCGVELVWEYAPASPYQHRKCTKCRAEYFIGDNGQLVGNNNSAHDALVGRA